MFSQLGNVKKYNKLSEKLSKQNQETPSLEQKKTVPITSVINTKSNENSKTFVPSIFAKEEKDDDLVDIEDDEEKAEKKEEPPKSIISSTSSFFSNIIGTSTSDSKANDKNHEVQDHEVEDHEVPEPEEQETEFILDKPDYIMQGVPYHYLNDTEDFMNSTLTREWIDSLQETGTSEIEVQVALYKWNGTIQYVPFITYLLEKQSDMYAFPRFTIPMSKDEDDNGTYDFSTEDILNHTCQNECKKRIFHHLHIRPNKRFLTSKVIEHIIFKGYITRKGANEILAVFETKSELPDIRENCQWVTLHEMINTKFIYSYKIHPLVSTWFLENSALIYVKDKFSKSVEIPYVLYLLEELVEDSESLKERKEDSSSDDSYSDDSSEKKKKTKTKSLGGKREEKIKEKPSTSFFDALPAIPSIPLSNMFSSTTPPPLPSINSNSNSKSKYQPIETIMVYYLILFVIQI